MIGIIDYGVGNIKAFANIYKRLNIPHKIICNIDDLFSAEKLILPGVGAFDYAMQKLDESGMRTDLSDLVLNKNIPVLGICVGLQMLAKLSEEGCAEGLGWINAKVKKIELSQLEKNLPLPHMGWNTVEIVKKSQLLHGFEQAARFYFLHSYYFECEDEADTLATSVYGLPFTSVVGHNNIYGIQCHPEKSHHNGVKLLQNFAELC